VTADLYSRAKSVFMRAVELPPEDRLSFVDEACDGDLELREEVVGLLEHHCAETLQLRGSVLRTLVGSPGSAPTWWPGAEKQRETGSPRVAVAAESPQIADETSRLLRQRLKALTLVLGGLLLVSLVADIIYHELLIPWLRVLVLGLILGLCGLLHSRRSLPIRVLRWAEVGVLLTVGLQLVVVPSVTMVWSARAGDIAETALAAAWNYAGWSILILINGVFVPNTWKRAAFLLLPAAVVPLVVVPVVASLSEPVDRYLVEGGLELMWMMPPVAALAAVYAAHIHDSTRRAEFQARKFGQYRLTERIGGGGMGEVYKAEHRLLKRPCALKLILPSHTADPNFLARFEREVRATARLTHWNTIQIYDFGRTAEGAFYYVMELLDGLNLGEIVRRAGPLAPARAVHLLRQTCAALEEAHASGLIHRDIKPENIFAARLGVVYDVAKLLDFGVVKEPAKPGDPRLTAQGTVVGTSFYMSPEQATADVNITPRADLYSLGAVAYFLLTGQPPFVRPHAAEVLIAHVREKAKPPCEIVSDLPADLERIVLQCLAKKPGDRFASAADLEHALAACDCADQWTQDQAAAWWREHDPQAAS
jgi:serine/threonine-protein kinase